jgi:hypothetical protein
MHRRDAIKGGLIALAGGGIAWGKGTGLESVPELAVQGFNAPNKAVEPNKLLDPNLEQHAREIVAYIKRLRRAYAREGLPTGLGLPQAHEVPFACHPSTFYMSDPKVDVRPPKIDRLLNAIAQYHGGSWWIAGVGHYIWKTFPPLPGKEVKNLTLVTPGNDRVLKGRTVSSRFVCDLEELTPQRMALATYGIFESI